jgi:ketosteroid isomerase-like protein
MDKIGVKNAMTRPMATIDRLVNATNQHDLESLTACFSEDYQNETPAHPARGFRGRAQVRRNWEQIFAFIPDIRAEVVRSAVEADTVWTEWEMRGTRRDGKASLMRGIIVFGVSGEAIRWARFYLEPVDESDATVDDTIREQVAPK